MSSVKIANHRVITPEQANLPSDVLEAIPLEGIENSATGDEPKDLLHQIGDIVGGAITSVANFIHRGLVALANLIEHAGEVVAQFAMKLLDATKQAIKTVVEVVKNVVNAVIGWVKSMIANGIKALMSGLKDMADSIIGGIGRSLKGMALDIANGNTVGIGGDVVEVLRKVTPLVWDVTTAFMVFAAIEIAIDASTDGIAALISGRIESILKDEVIRDIVSVFLIADATVTALDKVTERTGHGISEGVIKNLLKSFDIAIAIEGEIWTVYKIFGERADKGRLLFYVGLGLAVASTIATMVGDTLNLHGDALKWYDLGNVGISALGLFLMWKGKSNAPEQNLPWTGLLEWIVGFSGLMSSLIKLGADWHGNFK